MSRQAAHLKQGATTEVYSFLDKVKEYYEKGWPLPEWLAADAISRIRAADAAAHRHDLSLPRL